MELLFVTNNEKKIKAAKNILEKENIIIRPVSLSLQEIQGTPEEVAITKAKEAFLILKKPLIINDCSFCIEALHDFPSVYANYVENTLKDVGILKLLDGEKNRKAYYLDILIYIDKYGYQIFTSKTKGKISETSLEGDFYPYDKIFIQEGDSNPIAASKEKLHKLYENNTYLDLGKFLKKRKVSRGITFIGDNVLLLHRIRKDGDDFLSYYAIPGGGVELGETFEEACIREVREETTVDVSLQTYLGHETYENGVCYYFLTKYLKGTPTLGGEEKERNNKDNFYEIKLIPIFDIDKISMYGSGVEMIKKAYEIFKNNN